MRAVKRERENREEEAEVVEGEARENRHGTTERRALRSRYLAVKNLISGMDLVPSSDFCVVIENFHAHLVLCWNFCLFCR